jgi:hypothetical protein
MSLLPEDVLAQIPPLGSAREAPLERMVVHARLYDPESSWEWLVMEFDGGDQCFGLILTRSTALAGRFTLRELASVEATVGGGAGVLLDPRFEPVTVGRLGLGDPRVGELLRELRDRGEGAGGDLVSIEGPE